MILPGWANFNPKCQISLALGVFKRKYFKFYYIQIRKINDPRGGANFDPRAFI
jgi:hypothetical protein